jgi:AraC-like DNA-binding protein
MAEVSSVSIAVVARATPLPQTAGATLHWDGRSGVCRAVGPHTLLEHVPPSPLQVKGPPTPAYRARLYWTTGEIGFVPAFPPQAIVWEKAAALLTFSLDPLLLADTTYAVLPGATGELVWVHWQEQTASPTPVVHPALIVHATDASLQAERIKIVPYVHAHDPLLHHLALVLRAAIEGEGVAEQLYATSLADALVVHFLRRYAASRQSLPAVPGGLAPSKLQRTIAYIKAHLEQALSLAELAAVAQTSPTHFARLFKHATGLAPHRYVITSRMEQAKRLLATTDVSLSEIGLQVGCADHSHFTALFRKYVATTPKAYRTTTRPTFL